MARTVTDLVHLLVVIAGVDPADAATAEASGKIPIIYPILAPKPRESGECRLESASEFVSTSAGVVSRDNVPGCLLSRRALSMRK